MFCRGIYLFVFYLVSASCLAAILGDGSREGASAELIKLGREPLEYLESSVPRGEQPSSWEESYPVRMEFDNPNNENLLCTFWSTADFSDGENTLTLESSVKKISVFRNSSVNIRFVFDLGCLESFRYVEESEKYGAACVVFENENQDELNRYPDPGKLCHDKCNWIEEI